MLNPSDIFVTGLQALAQQMSSDSAQRQGIQTLGDLRRALDALPAETPVRLDTGGNPGDVASYRGYYERLAIATGEPTTTGAFAKVLDAADGQTFHGYKGGAYRMNSGTYVHVAEYGDCGRYVTGVAVVDGVAIIQTDEEEW